MKPQAAQRPGDDEDQRPVWFPEKRGRRVSCGLKAAYGRRGKFAAERAPEGLTEEEKEQLHRSLEDQMLSAAKSLDFEKAVKLRDELFSIKGEKAEKIQKPQSKRRKPLKRR